MRSRKIVVTGASTYGVKNHGDDAMLATLTQGLLRLDPTTKITFLCRHPDAGYDSIFGFKSLKNLDHDSKEAATGRVFWGLNPGDSTDHLQAITKAIGEADLLIIGGNSFMEIFPNGFLKGVSSYSATLATIAKFVGTPFSLFGLNVVEEVSQKTTCDHLQFLVGSASAVTLREERGKNYLVQAGASEENLYVLGDPAFGIEPREIDAQACLRLQGIDLDGGPVIGVAFRHQYWNGDAEHYDLASKNFAIALDEVIERIKAKLLFIPNCTYTHGSAWQDDRVVHRQIKEHMAFKDSAFCVENELSVFETLGLFKVLDLHVSNRRHSCVFAALNNVPFLAIDGGLPGHMPPFMSDLGIPEQLTDFKDPRSLAKAILKTYATRSQIKQTMKPHVESLALTARQHVPILMEMV